ncbi:MAG TPA: hypothetical protein VGI87_04505 [Solirubrobacteraceae bacterium]|jgi:hypothetical protein
MAVVAVAVMLGGLTSTVALARRFPRPPGGQGRALASYHIIVHGRHARGRAGIWLFPHPPGIGSPPELCVKVRPVRGFQLRSTSPLSSFAIAHRRRKLFILNLARNGACVGGRNIKLGAIAKHPRAYTLEIWPHGGSGRPAVRGRL